MGRQVEIIDVAPRDGLQNEPNPISTAEKVALIGRLADAGLKAIQATSFVHPKLVPQMADAADVCQALGGYSGIRFSALFPNLKGYERAAAAGLKQADFVISASEAFNRRNLNCTIDESLVKLREVCAAAERNGVTLRVDISTAFHCPFEGRTPTESVIRVARAVRECGVRRIAIDDTDGMAFPDQITAAVIAMGQEAGIDPADVIVHLHDTYGRGLVNAAAALEAGIRAFDTSVGGLGGCPFSPGASGNLATEDLVALLDGLGYTTGIDLEKLLDAAELAVTYSSRPYQGHLLKARRPQALADRTA